MSKWTLNKSQTKDQRSSNQTKKIFIVVNLFEFEKNLLHLQKHGRSLNFKPGQTVICNSLFREINGVLYAFVFNNTKHIDHHRHNSITVTLRKISPICLHFFTLTIVAQHSRLLQKSSHLKCSLLFHGTAAYLFLTFPEVKSTFPEVKSTFPLVKLTFPLVKLTFPLVKLTFPEVKLNFPPSWPKIKKHVLFTY